MEKRKWSRRIHEKGKRTTRKRRGHDREVTGDKRKRGGEAEMFSSLQM